MAWEWHTNQAAELAYAGGMFVGGFLSGNCLLFITTPRVSATFSSDLGIAA